MKRPVKSVEAVDHDGLYALANALIGQSWRLKREGDAEGAEFAAGAAYALAWISGKSDAGPQLEPLLRRIEDGK